MIEELTLESFGAKWPKDEMSLDEAIKQVASIIRNITKTKDTKIDYHLSQKLDDYYLIACYKHNKDKDAYQHPQPKLIDSLVLKKYQI